MMGYEAKDYADPEEAGRLIRELDQARVDEEDAAGRVASLEDELAALELAP